MNWFIRISALFLFALLALCRVSVHAQEYFSQPQATLLTSFSFRQFNGGVILLKARLDNFPDSLNFILDTGSGGISLDSATVEYLQIPTIDSDKMIRGIAGSRKVKFANNHTLYFPGLVVDSLNFHINDYDILTSVYGEKIDGIIGFSFFSRYIIKLDYDTLEVKVYSKGPMKYPRGGFLLKPAIVSIPVISARLKEENERNTRYFFDTGAGLSLLLTEDFVNDSTVFSRKKRILNTMAEGLGGKTSMQLTTVKEIKLGPYKFRKVPTYIFSDEYNVTNYPYLGGLIGNDLLRRFNVILNYERRELYLIPNKHYREPFDYAYTGLGIYFINGQVTVTDIMPGSPAEKAGFQEGDILVAVENNMSRNIQVYRNLLQQAGQRLKFLVREKNGELTERYMKVGNILKKR